MKIFKLIPCLLLAATSVLAQVNLGIYPLATASGVDTYTATVIPSFQSYTTGQRFSIKFTNSNTGASTININSKGTVNLVKSGSTALSSGDISAGQILLLQYDGTNMQLIGGGSTGSGGGETVTVSNGLSKVGNDIRLGGLVTDATIENEYGELIFDNTNSSVSLRGKNGGIADLYGGNFSSGYKGFYVDNSNMYGQGELVVYHPRAGILSFDSTAQSVKFGSAGISGWTGVEYMADPSSNFTNLSFTHKGYVLGAKTFTGKQTFTSSPSLAGINVGTLSGDPSSLSNGDIWYNSSTGKFRARQNGSTIDLVQLLTNYVRTDGTSTLAGNSDLLLNSLDFRFLPSVNKTSRIFAGETGNTLDLFSVHSEDVKFHARDDGFESITLTPTTTDIRVNNGVSTTTLGMRTTEVTLTGNAAGFPGIQYGSDYSPSYTARSLVDKAYVEGRALEGQATLDFASTTATAVARLTITVTGAAVGDPVSLGIPTTSVTATGTYSAWVSAANTVTVQFSPKATEDPASGLFKVSVHKP